MTPPSPVRFFSKFQSTHPVWGATRYHMGAFTDKKISIHAPRVGCDTNVERAELWQLQFQSTHPVWGATGYLWSEGINLIMISIHAPRVGCDFQETRRQCAHQISIHAPRVGCDTCESQPAGHQEISIHAPRVGCDRPRQTQRSTQSIFQSTHPVWGATDDRKHGGCYPA